MSTWTEPSKVIRSCSYESLCVCVRVCGRKEQRWVAIIPGRRTRITKLRYICPLREIVGNTQHDHRAHDVAHWETETTWKALFHYKRNQDIASRFLLEYWWIKPTLFQSFSVTPGWPTWHHQSLNRCWQLLPWVMRHSEGIKQ